MKFLILLSALFTINAKAELNADDLALADEAIQSPAMNIEGKYTVKEEAKAAPAVIETKIIPPKRAVRKITQSDRLRMYRERLEEHNRIMIEKKIEQIRFRQELALSKRLEQSMNQTLNAIDSVKN